MLYIRFGVGFPKGVFQSREAIEYAKQHVCRSTAIQVLEYFSPAVRALLPTNIETKNIALTVLINAKCEVNGFTVHRTTL
ncbi:hypothetical protein D3C77_694910 [compost metagenome]